jgi:hypothetical protein
MIKEFNFYGVFVRVHSESEGLLSRISKDFSYFGDPERLHNWNIFHKLEMVVHERKAPKGTIPGLEALKQSQNSMTFEKNRIRYNDYYGEAVSILNYQSSEAVLYSEDINRLHEVTFLLILSRVEKALDLHGLHKIHAFGVTYNGTNLIGQMPSKGGKTTLLTNLIKNPDVKILSDDTPLITRDGRVLPFPLRIGVDKLDPELQVRSECLYEISRKQYGKKTLIDIKGLRNGISSGSIYPTVLFYGVRRSDTHCEITPCSKLEMVGPLVKNMVVGIGLPMVLEYFLETGIADLIRKTRIILSRSIAMLGLLARSKTYKVSLGTDIAANTRMLQAFMSQGAAVVSHSDPVRPTEVESPSLDG